MCAKSKRIGNIHISDKSRGNIQLRYSSHGLLLSFSNKRQSVEVIVHSLLCLPFCRINSTQRVRINFCVKLDKSATVTFEMINNAFDDGDMNRSKIPLNGTIGLLGGREAINVDHRTGRTTTLRNSEIVANVREIFRSDRRITIREIFSECNVSYGS